MIRKRKKEIDMKKLLLLYMCLLLLLGSVMSQNPNEVQKVNEKLKARKIALISERLELTPEQAEKFWPIYNEFSQRQQAIKTEFRQQRGDFNPKTASDEEMKKMIDMGLKVKERQLNLEREYADRMRKIINNRQLLSLRKAEEEFRQMLIQRLQKARQQQRNRQRNNANRNQRRNN